MEVLELRAALVSNAEVYHFLKDLEHTRKDPRLSKQSHKEDGMQDLMTVEYEALKYLDQTPSSVQTTADITSFLTQIASFPLTKGEKLMLLNLRPTSTVQLNVCIEECESRLTEARQNELLDIIASTLPSNEVEADVNGVERDLMDE
ncbi:hypothetical protein HDV00_006572 [Rhizophlyctis rosea]|nr:hypothetical protein HDV00_006572 [Rhizophlyctis rosea]